MPLRKVYTLLAMPSASMSRTLTREKRGATVKLPPLT